MTVHLRPIRKAQTWLDDALDGRVPAVVRADFADRYAIIGAFPDGGTAEVTKGVGSYIEKPSNYWSEDYTPSGLVRATFHASEVTIDMTFDPKRVPENEVHKLLFEQLTWPVRDAYQRALYDIKIKESRNLFSEYETRKHLLRESPHWFEMVAPRHAVPVMRVRHGVSSDTYSMCLEWANLKRV